MDDSTYNKFADHLAKNGGKVTTDPKKKVDEKPAANPVGGEKKQESVLKDTTSATLVAEFDKLKKDYAELNTKQQAQAKELDEKVKELTKTAQEYKEKHLASLADKDNLVKIAKRDVDNAKEFGIKQIVVKLFDVVDTLNICIENMKDEHGTKIALAVLVVAGLTVHLSGLEAMESVKKQFMKILMDYGVEELSPKVGDKFDVNHHNALFEIEPTAAEHKARHIGLIVKNGWIRKGALLRPAAVGVYSKDFAPAQE